MGLAWGLENTDVERKGELCRRDPKATLDGRHVGSHGCNAPKTPGERGSLQLSERVSWALSLNVKIRGFQLSLGDFACLDPSDSLMVLPVGLISKHRSGMQTQRASLEMCVLGTSCCCITDPSNWCIMVTYLDMMLQ